VSVCGRIRFPLPAMGMMICIIFECKTHKISIKYGCLPLKMASKKYFIALVPPPQIRDKAELLKQELFTQFGLRGSLRSPAHITLHRPFEWKEQKEEALISGLSEFRFAPVPVTLRGFSSFAPRVIFIDVLPDERLVQLHSALAAFCRQRFRLYNESEDERGFHPHVTIAFRDLKKNRFSEVWDYVDKKSFSENFVAERISLLKLESRWEVLRDFPI
jgi:2'-5' RNA ligase